MRNWCAVDRNPIDELWTDRPAPPLEKIEIHPIAYAGELARDKLARLAAALASEGVAHTVLTDPSSIAWAFNIRGHDLPHTPLALAFAILSAEGPHLLFIDPRKLTIETKAYLTQLADLLPTDALDAELARLAAGGARIGLDPALAAEHLRTHVEASGGKVVPVADPARLPRATKNQTEIAGTRAAHRRDGAAVTKMLAWLDRQAPGSLDEITAVTRLEEFRRTTGAETQMPLREISFDTISGAGPNGAIMHYRVSHATNRSIASRRALPHRFRGAIPGRHHRLTRTVSVGAPTQAMRRHYTIVLKGMVGMSMLRFPAGYARHGHRRCRPASPIGRPASTMRTAPGMASAHICRCMRGRSASPRPAAKNCWPA